MNVKISWVVCVCVELDHASISNFGCLGGELRTLGEAQQTSIHKDFATNSSTRFSLGKYC